jgi:hypothetical protein
VRGDGRDEPSIILMVTSLTILILRDAPINLSEDGFIHTRSEAQIFLGEALDISVKQLE